MPLDDHTAMAGCWASRFPCAAARVAGLPALEWFRCHDSSTREPRIFPATGTNDAAKDGAGKEDQGIGPGVCPTDTRVINTDTMGYGTDQEYVAFRSWKYCFNRT
jgi:hypothetical protein